jgi:hypothetical protein
MPIFSFISEIDVLYFNIYFTRLRACPCAIQSIEKTGQCVPHSSVMLTLLVHSLIAPHWHAPLPFICITHITHSLQSAWSHDCAHVFSVGETDGH